ncbi:MAG: XRE family transcriptional regulator [Methylocystaceae bacterium]|nr:XRE family transcriptional regulator [Methylocystaceae bacterium]
MAKSPNPIDRHVGSRVKLRRNLLGMSQEKLGAALGLSFQQIQKYEKGTNRIGASRLQQISKILKVMPAFFFEGAPTLSNDPAVGFSEDGTPGYVTEFLSTVEGLQVCKAFARIQDIKVRKRLVELLVSLAAAEEAGGGDSA